MKLLILGSNGQVGKSLCNLCSNNQIDYISTTRQELDISDEIAVKKFFLNTSVDYVVNAIAYTNVELAEDEIQLADQINEISVGYLSDQCSKNNLPLIHISTDYIFDGKKDGMYNEDDLPSPLNRYGLSKLNGERQLQKKWSKHIILRVSWVFSEFGNNFLKTMLKLAKSNEQLNVISNQFGSPTSANSIAKIILHICKKIDKDNNFKDWGVYNYTDFPVTTWHQFSTYIVDHYKDSIVNYIQPILSNSFPVKASRPQNSALDTNKIRKIFEIKQYSWLSETDRVLHILNKA